MERGTYARLMSEPQPHFLLLLHPCKSPANSPINNSRRVIWFFKKVCITKETTFGKNTAFLTHPTAKKILLAPLDWGLGHTTRCIPLAQYLQRLGATVYFAGTAAQQAFFRNAVPQAQLLTLDGYGVTYSKTRRGFLPHLLRQLPRIFQTIKAEHQWLLAAVQEHGFDGVISDNRYGLWHPTIPSVFMTHQPGLKTGLGAWADGLFARLHQRLMQRFIAVWLVDVPEEGRLSGDLAHPTLLPENAQYIGLLSQFEASGNTGTKEGLLVLLSGPEPQRTMLSDVLWQQVQDLAVPVVFVEGRADAPERVGSPNLRWAAQLGATELLPLMHQARYVVSRSGYSTLMDAAALDLKLILIPTPGQTEQEYLGKRLFRNRQALCYRQETFNFQKALADAAHFPFSPLGAQDDFERFRPVLETWYGQL